MNLQANIVAEQHARPLHIRRVDASPVALPLAKPMVMAAERIATAENLIVRIEADKKDPDKRVRVAVKSGSVLD